MFIWINSCNGNSFADMTLTLHKSQVHCFGNMQLWACSSLMFAPCLQRQVEKLGSELFYYGHCCVTVVWQQIFEESLQVTVVSVLPHVTIECRRLGK